MSKVEEVIFSQAVEGLFVHGLRDRVTAKLKERLRGNRIDLDRPLEPAYARVVWAQALELARQEVFGELPVHAGYFALGESVISGYAQTMVGRALYAVARVLGPKRMLARMTHNLRTASNFNETALTERPDGSYEFWVNEGLINPHYFAGLLDAAMRVAGAQKLDVLVKGQDDNGATYVIRWS